MASLKDRIVKALSTEGGERIIADLEAQAARAEQAAAKRRELGAELVRLRTEGKREIARLEKIAAEKWEAVTASRKALLDVEAASRGANHDVLRATSDNTSAIQRAERELIGSADARIAHAMKRCGETLSEIASGRLLSALLRSDGGKTERDPLPEDPDYKSMRLHGTKYVIQWSSSNASAVDELTAQARNVPNRLRELALIPECPADLDERIAVVMQPIDAILSGNPPPMVTRYADRPYENGAPGSVFR